MKKNQDVKHLLTSYKDIPVSNQHMKKVITLSQQTLAETGVSSLCLSDKIRWLQIFINKKVILLQLAFLLIATFGLYYFLADLAVKDLLFWLSIIASVLVVGFFPEMMKSFSYHMAELEATFKFQLQELLALKLTVFGLLSIAGVLVLAFFSSLTLQFSLLRVLLYLCLPFTLLNGMFFLSFNLRFTSGFFNLGIFVVAAAILCLLLREINFYQLSLLQQVVPNLLSTGLLLLSLTYFLKKREMV